MINFSFCSIKKRVTELSRFTRLQLPVNQDISNCNNKVPQNDTFFNVICR